MLVVRVALGQNVAQLLRRNRRVRYGCCPPQLDQRWRVESVVWFIESRARSHVVCLQVCEQWWRVAHDTTGSTNTFSPRFAAGEGSP